MGSNLSDFAAFGVKTAESPLRMERSDAGALAAKNVRVSLRSKGIFAYVALVVYVVVVGMLVAHERGRLFAAVQELEQLHALEERLAKVNTSLAHAILKLQDLYYSAADFSLSYENVALDIEAVQASLEGLKQHDPKFQNRIAALDSALGEMRANPERSNLLVLRMCLHDLVAELDEFTRRVRDRKDRLAEEYRLAYDAITLIALIGGLVGVILFGGLVALFFTRLAWDIKKLEARALDVVAGDRGPPLKVMRQDEVGSLMESVNRMQLALRQREQQLEISRRQSFHQEKMAALGSLAASVAHEINNPIAAITGVAEAIYEARCSSRCADMDAPCRPELILEQAKRISKITQQLADMSAPASPESQLLDLNAIVRNICSFITYDQRFRNVGLTLDLDPHLPAVFGVADHVTQILMNLLINAADAMEAVTSRKPSLAVMTRTGGDEAVLSVIDNGCGMDEETLAHAFDEAFTTKPAGRGSGLGLFMCKSLLAGMGGSIELESTPGEGTRATVRLPLSFQG